MYTLHIVQAVKILSVSISECFFLHIAHIQLVNVEGEGEMEEVFLCCFFPKLQLDRSIGCFMHAHSYLRNCKDLRFVSHLYLFVLLTD